jgi:SP family general alpha glucoside:H+ symporter-like MFS transporter
MSVILFFYNCGVGGIYPVVGAETSSVRLRAKSSGIGFMVNAFFSWLFNFVVPYMFDADEANLGGKMGFFFFGLCVIGLVVVFLEVPEMKNKTYAELDELFEARVPTRKFKTYQTIASTGNRTASHVSGMEEM